MNIRKIIGISISLTLVLGLSGCMNKSLQSDVNIQPNNDQTQDIKTGQTDKLSQDNGVESKDKVDDGNSSKQNRIDAVLNTRVPLMLPTNVPVEKGKYLTGTTISQTWYYKVNFYQSNQPDDINSQTASKGTLIATVEGTEYKDVSRAKEAVNGYVQVDTAKYPEMEIDLGNNIKALAEGAAGHGYLTWNEGRWCIRIDSPNDPAYKNNKYLDSKKLAKNIVAYLNDHMLPAPQTIGVISVNNWGNSHGTTIQWQYKQMVYQVWSQDPMTALKVAVSMKFK